MLKSQLEVSCEIYGSVGKSKPHHRDVNIQCVIMAVNLLKELIKRFQRVIVIFLRDMLVYDIGCCAFILIERAVSHSAISSIYFPGYGLFLHMLYQ